MKPSTTTQAVCVLVLTACLCLPAGEVMASDGPMGDTSEIAAEMQAEAYAKKWFGVSGAERRWHEKMGTDPYTTNQVLRRRIKELSKVDAAASTGMRFVPIPRIPGAS